MHMLFVFNVSHCRLQKSSLTISLKFTLCFHYMILHSLSNFEVYWNNSLLFMTKNAFKNFIGWYLKTMFFRGKSGNNVFCSWLILILFFWVGRTTICHHSHFLESRCCYNMYAKYWLKKKIYEFSFWWKNYIRKKYARIKSERYDLGKRMSFPMVFVSSKSAQKHERSFRLKLPLISIVLMGRRRAP